MVLIICALVIGIISIIGIGIYQIRKINRSYQEKNDNIQLMKEISFLLNEEMNAKQDVKDLIYHTIYEFNSITITSSILSISSFNRSIACTNGLCVEIDEIEIGGYCGTGGAPWIGLSIDVLLSIDVSELSSGFLFCLVGIVVVSVIRNGRYTT